MAELLSSGVGEGSLTYVCFQYLFKLFDLFLGGLFADEVVDHKLNISVLGEEGVEMPSIVDKNRAGAEDLFKVEISNDTFYVKVKDEALLDYENVNASYDVILTVTVKHPLSLIIRRTGEGFVVLPRERV